MRMLLHVISIPTQVWLDYLRSTWVVTSQYVAVLSAEATSYRLRGGNHSHCTHTVCIGVTPGLHDQQIESTRRSCGIVRLWDRCMYIHLPNCAMLNQAIWLLNSPRGSN